MFYRNHSSKHLSMQVVTLAAGLALATAAIISGSEVLKEKNSAPSSSAATSRVERIEPQFGTAADAAFASIGLAYLRAPTAVVETAPQFPTMADAVASLPVPAVEDALPGLGTVTDPAPLFANEVDAWVQSITQPVP